MMMMVAIVVVVVVGEKVTEKLTHHFLMRAVVWRARGEGRLLAPGRIGRLAEEC